MAILSQLGINYTTFYCFFIFLFTFFFLKELLFHPYFIAYQERERRTKGGENYAKDLQLKTKQIKEQYEDQARDLNAEIKSIFDESRGIATKEYEKVVYEARQSAEREMEETRSQINKELSKAQSQLSLEVPGVALAITKKMLD